MDRRPLIGFFLILLVWMFFLPKPQPPEQQTPATETPQTVVSKSATSAAAPGESQKDLSAASTASAQNVPLTFRTLENENLQIVLSSRQAALKDISLKHYKTEKKPNSPWVNLA